MPKAQPLDLEQEVLDAFEHCCRVTEYVVQVLPSEVWSADPPAGKGRSIPAIVAHMQSVRRMFVKMGGANPVPATLDRARSTPVDAHQAFQQSREALVNLFGEAIAERRSRVKRMPRRVVNMMFYLTQHEAHHRGQICMIARSLGHRFSKDDIMRIWGWKNLA